MKRNLVISKFVLLMIVASLLIPLSSCNKKRIRLSSDEPLSYFITYLKDEIIINSSEPHQLSSHFFYKDGEYFSSRDSMLYFSTIRDTILNNNNGGTSLRVVIKKEKEGLFKTSSYIVNNTVTDDGPIFLYITYYYDSKYRISKVIKDTMLEYK